MFQGWDIEPMIQKWSFNLHFTKLLKRDIVYSFYLWLLEEHSYLVLTL